MKDVPEVLDKMVDAVLGYKPKPKSKAAKKRHRKAAKKGKAQAHDSLPSNPPHTSENTPQASTPQFPASNLAIHSSGEPVSVPAHRLAKDWGSHKPRIHCLRWSKTLEYRAPPY